MLCLTKAPWYICMHVYMHYYSYPTDGKAEALMSWELSRITHLCTHNKRPVTQLWKTPWFPGLSRLLAWRWHQWVWLSKSFQHLFMFGDEAVCFQAYLGLCLLYVHKCPPSGKSESWQGQALCNSFCAPTLSCSSPSWPLTAAAGRVITSSFHSTMWS